MRTPQIIHHRLVNQQIAKTKFTSPQEIVEWMGAMQAQDFAMAKWAIGLRLRDWKDSDVEKAFNKGVILRTHLLRPTWHFVTPVNIRWMLALTAPRIRAANAYMYAKLELDKKIFRRSNKILEKNLRDGKQLTRAMLNTAFKQAKISANGLRLGYIMMHAELDALICSGAWMGKQFTYALLDERVPSVKSLSRDEALIKFTRLFFTSRGPATITDFAYWSWLTVKDAKEGFEMIRSEFTTEIIGGSEYIFKSFKIENNLTSAQTSFLMPDYDEYGMSYKKRDVLNPHSIGGRMPKENPVFNHMVIIDGVFGGTWQRAIKNKKLSVKTTCFSSLNKAQRSAVTNAVKKYKVFIGEE